MPNSFLKEYFRTNQPLGPVVVPDNRSEEIIKALFYKENRIHSEMARHPSPIIGRRGSGKTAFMVSAYLDPDYKIRIELPAEQAFRKIIDSIEEMSTGVVFTEEVAALWNTILWHTIFLELAKLSSQSDNLRIVKDYLRALGLERKRSPYSIMQEILRILKDRGGDKALSIVSEFIHSLAFENFVFKDVKESAIKFMSDEKVRAIILLDALEDFKLDIKTSRQALSGLLRCQGEFNQIPGRVCEIRCCMPSESYFELHDLSANPNKDFQNRIILHWHVSELIRLAAHRYLTFFKLHYPDLLKEFLYLDLDKRAGAVSFWHSILPMKIENRIGIVEDTLSYIIRHTQLLPRQLLLYLNRIIENNLKANRPPNKIEPPAVLDGIFATENDICTEILVAFGHVYPNARQACTKIIKYLPFHFSDSELRKVYSRYGKGIAGASDYDDFRKMMVEIGAIGKVTDTTKQYIIGHFEYIVPNRLIISKNDTLCLHPLFIEVFHAKKPELSTKTRTTFPYGSALDDMDKRELM